MLPRLSENVYVPAAVVEEITRGLEFGINLPKLDTLEWIKVKHPISEIAIPLVTDLGPGETAVLMLGLEMPDAVAVLDDLLARRVAEKLQMKLTGTLGVHTFCSLASLTSCPVPSHVFLDSLSGC